MPRMQVVSATEIVRVGGKILLDTGIEARRTRLLGGQADRSTQAVSYVRQRVLVLQRRLFRQPWLGQRMFYHELCHFLWPRLGTPARHRFAAHLAREVRQGVRGELGYSAQYCKDRLPHRRAPRSSPAWPEYVCESFCDTGAYYLSLAAGVGHRLRSVEFTLAPRYRPVRLVAWQRALAR